MRRPETENESGLIEAIYEETKTTWIWDRSRQAWVEVIESPTSEGQARKMPSDDEHVEPKQNVLKLFTTMNLSR